MSRIEAALEDLIRLGRDSSALDSELGPCCSDLGAALDLAWATSASVLPARGDLDQQLWSQLRVGAALAEAADGAAARLVRAGTDGPALRVIALGSPRSPAGRLALHLAVGRLAQLTGAMWGRMEGAFADPGRRTPPHVVQSRTETYSAAVLMGDGSISLIWEELSDGSVRVSATQTGGVTVGVGWGAEVAGTIKGVDLGNGGGAAGADGRLVLAAVQSWTFRDKQAAEQFWQDYHDPLLAQVLVPGGSAGAAVLDRLQDALLGEGGLPPSDQAYVEIGLEAALSAGLGFSSGLGALLGQLGGLAARGRADASYAASDRVRLHQDGSVTVITSVAAVAGADFGAEVGPTNASGQATAGADVTIEVTASPSGQLRQVVWRTVFQADPGQPISLNDALGVTSAASSLNTELHTYEATLTLDLTVPAIRDHIETSLGLDLDSTADQLEAVLATVQRHPALVTAALVSVLERAAPQDNTISVGVNVELGPIDVGLSAHGGTTNQSTEAAWEKRPGSTELAAAS